MPRRPLSIVFALLLSVALAGEVQADGANGDSAASLSIRGVNVKVVNSSACSIETRIGISSRYVTKTLAPGDSVQFAGSGLPVLSNVTGAAIVSTPDCKQSVSAEGIFTNPQIGEPFCLCAFDTTTWQESFSEKQSRALADRTVGLVVTRNNDTSNFKNFTMTISGNGETNLQARPAPATARVARTANRRALRVRITPRPGPGKSWRFRVQKRRSGVWKSVPGTYYVAGNKTVRTESLGRGTYRVRVLAGNGLPGSSSRARRLIN